MSHHVFIPKKPTKHHVGFGVLVGLLIVGVVGGWVATTGRAMLATMAAAQQDLSATVETAREVRDRVSPPPVEPTPEPEPAPVEKADPDFDPVIEKMKTKLEAASATEPIE